MRLSMAVILAARDWQFPFLLLLLYRYEWEWFIWGRDGGKNDDFSRRRLHRRRSLPHIRRSAVFIYPFYVIFRRCWFFMEGVIHCLDWFPFLLVCLRVLNISFCVDSQRPPSGGGGGGGWYPSLNPSQVIYGHLIANWTIDICSFLRCIWSDFGVIKLVRY